MTADPTGAPRGRVLFVAANPSIDRLYELDRLTVGEIHRPVAVVAVPGGKGLNAARAGAALGGSVTAVGIVGGRAGDWIVERLAELGVGARMAGTAVETRTCVSILDRSTGALSEIYERGAEIEAAAWDALETIIRAELQAGDVAVVAVSGSLPRGAPSDGYGRIARIARERARPVDVLADTYGSALATVLAERPSVVKLNASEAAEASGIPVSDAATAADAAAALLDAGASHVIVTLGPGGAVLVSADQRIRLVPPDVQGVYAVGSGDAFFGGLAVACARGDSVADAARLGLAAGIANALAPGAGVLDPTAIEAILDGVEVAPA